MRRHSILATLAFALILWVGWETLAQTRAYGAPANPQEAQSAYNSKCPGDKDDDCKE
jgi:hypothetical protein